jgi:hypothetical protein
MDAAPTEANAQLLDDRIAFIRDDFIPTDSIVEFDW